jgi:predicted DNA-binding transcriptional regulator AlpA
MPRLKDPEPIPSVDWRTMPDLLLLKEVCAITRYAIKAAYDLLADGKFPIAHLPNVRPYRFRRVDVQRWVVEGKPTNKAVIIANRRRKAA